MTVTHSLCEFRYTIGFGQFLLQMYCKRQRLTTQLSALRFVQDMVIT